MDTASNEQQAVGHGTRITRGAVGTVAKLLTRRKRSIVTPGRGTHEPDGPQRAAGEGPTATARSPWIESGSLCPASQALGFDVEEVGYVRRFVNPATPNATIYVHFFTFPTNWMRPAPPAAFYPGRAVHYLVSTDPERPFATAEWQAEIIDRSLIDEGDRGYQTDAAAEIDALVDATGFDPAWLDWQGNRFNVGIGPHPTSTRDAHGCEHYFPEPEELGCDPEVFPGGPEGRGNCTVCRMTWEEFRRLVPEAARHLFEV